ncbi:MAG: DUF4112 domain-containing protein [Leptolyngbyaceae cyanobacterium SL_7_1]|nr:DUF4112 domain-containing protein [Leptolyngbyaceae cyanobacterium SL_7_1]
MSNLPSDRPSVIHDPRFVKRLDRLRNFSRLLDNAIAIPGTNYRIGLDPLIGLIPGGGDTAGMILSTFIVYEAARMGASKEVLTQMAVNILLETVVGTVPAVGDVFDAAWKSNARNVRLVEDFLRKQGHVSVVAVAARPRNRWFAVLLIVLLVLVFIGCLAISLWILQWVLQGLGAFR